MAGVALAVGGGGARALDEGPTPCHEDAVRRCAHVVGEADRDRCTLQRELACEEEGQGRPPRRGATDLRRACRADFGALCGDVGPEASRSRVVRCLEERRSFLSDACRSALDALPADEGADAG